MNEIEFIKFSPEISNNMKAHSVCFPRAQGTSSLIHPRCLSVTAVANDLTLVEWDGEQNAFVGTGEQ